MPCREGYAALAPAAARVEAALTAHPEPLVPCHNDLLAANVLDDGGDLRFIDYEYSGMNEASFELGNLVNESQLDHDHLVELVEAYHGTVTRGCSRGPSCGDWRGAGPGRSGGRSSTGSRTSTTTSGTSRLERFELARPAHDQPAAGRPARRRRRSDRA